MQSMQEFLLRTRLENGKPRELVLAITLIELCRTRCWDVLAPLTQHMLQEASLCDAKGPTKDMQRIVSDLPPEFLDMLNDSVRGRRAAEEEQATTTEQERQGSALELNAWWFLTEMREVMHVTENDETR